MSLRANTLSRRIASSILAASRVLRPTPRAPLTPDKSSRRQIGKTPPSTPTPYSPHAESPAHTCDLFASGRRFRFKHSIQRYEQFRAGRLSRKLYKQMIRTCNADHTPTPQSTHDRIEHGGARYSRELAGVRDGDTRYRASFRGGAT